MNGIEETPEHVVLVAKDSQPEVDWGAAVTWFAMAFGAVTVAYFTVFLTPVWPVALLVLLGTFYCCFNALRSLAASPAMSVIGAVVTGVPIIVSTVWILFAMTWNVTF